MRSALAVAFLLAACTGSSPREEPSPAPAPPPPVVAAAPAPVAADEVAPPDVPATQEADAPLGPRSAPTSEAKPAPKRANAAAAKQNARKPAPSVAAKTTPKAAAQPPTEIVPPVDAPAEQSVTAVPARPADPAAPTPLLVSAARHEPAVGIDDKGRAIAVWHGRGIHASRYEPGKGWDEPVQLAKRGQHAEIAVTRTGDAIAIWRAGGGLWSRRYEDGAWGATRRLDDAAHGTVGPAPQIVADRDGNVLVVWSTHRASKPAEKPDAAADAAGDVEDAAVAAADSGLGGAHLWARRYHAVAGWDDPVEIGVEGWGKAWQAQVAVDSRGNAFVAWIWTDVSGVKTLWANRFDVTSGWAVPMDVPGTGTNPAAPRVAVDGGGNAFVMWQSTAGLEIDHFVPGGGWAEPTTLARSAPAARALAADGSGHVVAIWGHGAVRVARFVPGSGWTRSAQLTDGATIKQLAVDAAGRFTALLSQKNGAAHELWIRHYDRQSGWGAGRRLDVQPGDVTIGGFAVAPSGAAVVVVDERAPAATAAAVATPTAAPSTPTPVAAAASPSGAGAGWRLWAAPL